MSKKSKTLMELLTELDAEQMSILEPITVRAGL